MTNIKDRLELAEIAYRGENFSESYKNYILVIEENINNKRAWIGKGLSAGRKSTIKNNTLKEAKINLNKAKEIGLSKDEKKYIAHEILEIAEDFINKINQSVVDILTEKDKKPMATGELYAVRKVGQLADRIGAFNNHWEYFKMAIDFSKSSLEFDDSAKTYKGILSNIDLILNESNQHFHQDYLTQLKDWRKNTISSIKEYEPEFTAKPLRNDSGNCFIATAAYGSYDSPMVIELREFRDIYLKRSWIGRKFIQLYYFTSPQIAYLIEGSDSLKAVTKKTIKFVVLKIVRLLTR